MKTIYAVVDAIESEIIAAFADEEEAFDFDAAHGGCWTYTQDIAVYETCDEFQDAHPGFRWKREPGFCPHLA